MTTTSIDNKEMTLFDVDKRERYCS